jgi:thiosulfate/3-mercaptopyruvate sulfurtransferase
VILTTLVSTEVLAQHLNAPDWVVFDCRHELSSPDHGRSEYMRSHIPGARFLRLDEDLSAPTTGKNGRHPLPDPGVLAEMLSRAGVDAGKQVVVYDAQAGMVASRLWWMLRWMRHRCVAVLDGGWSKWMAEGRPQSAEIPHPQPARFAGTPNDSVVNAAFVLSHIGDRELTLLDARAPDRFRGQNETLDPVAGRIPGARNRFYGENLDAKGRFKSPAVLRSEFTAVIGDADPGNVVHYCGSGVSACHNLLAMELAGLRGGRLYAGSWSEWCADISRPVATGTPRTP